MSAERDRTPLAVVIVSFNTRDLLRACLASVIDEGVERIVVADNGSSDGSVEMVRREFPAVIVDVDLRNPGYGAGANRGIRRCDGADVLLLNGDTRVAGGCMQRLNDYLGAHPRAGIIGPRLLSPDGTLQRSCFPFPSPLHPPFERDPSGAIARHIPWLRDRLLSTWSHDRPRRVPWVMGAALVIRRRVFDDVNGFDESFFMYAEEIDLCYRARQRGWETHFAPGAMVFHGGGASTCQHRASMLAAGCSSIRQFYRRHYTGVRVVEAECAIAAAMAFRIARDGVRFLLAADPSRRTVLSENLSVWWHALVP